MKFVYFLLLAGAVFAGVTASARDDDFFNKPLSGSYFAFSGSYGDAIREPTKKEMRVTFAIKGKLARDMYDRLPIYHGPSCYNDGEDPRVEVRGKGDLWCWKDSKPGDVTCDFTMDVRTGKSGGSAGC